MDLIVTLAAATLPAHGPAAPAGRPGATATLIVALGAIVLGILWYADIIRPGSFRRARAGGGEGEGKGGGRDLGPETPAAEAIPWHLWLIAAIVTYLALLTAASTAASLLGGPSAPGSAPDLRASAIIGLAGYTASVIAGLALVRLFSTRVPAARAGLRFRPTDIPIGLALIALAAPVILAVMAVAPLIYALLTGETPDTVAHTQLRMILESRRGAEGGGGGVGIDPWLWPLLLGAAIGAPIAEELTYRVFLQTAVLTATRSPWAAVLATSVLFTAAHAGSVPLYAMPVLFTLSVAIGLSYERTARLGVPITMHAAFNAANLLATLAAS